MGKYFDVTSSNMAVIPSFLKFFQEYINLCGLSNWPNDNTTLEEIRNSFLISQHIEKCLDKLQEKSVIEEFLSIVNKKQNASSLFFKQCYSDPPKYILKKIINSSSNITLMDAAFSIFVELFSEKRLEICLNDFILQAASKEILLKNLCEFPREILLEFKSTLLLTEMSNINHSNKFILEMLKNCTKDSLDMLLTSLLNKDIKHHREVNIVLEAFEHFVSNKSNWTVSQTFWKLFFNANETMLLKIFLAHASIFKHVAKLLIDCGRLIKENMSMEYFHINLTFSELKSIVKIICKDNNLRLEFFDVIIEMNEDRSFWEQILCA